MKLIKIFSLSLLTLIIWLIVDQYFFCPYYSFPNPVAFEGKQLYNPYRDIDSGSWYKCNFHAHTNAWAGMTNGEASTADVWNNYDSLGYSVHCISDYQKIDRSFSDQKNYVPAYEHGYNCRKTHQLVLGDKHIKWQDFFFPQTLSNKQSIINTLKQNDSDVVILNHPQLKNGYSCKDVLYLANYQCMEVLNPSVN